MCSGGNSGSGLGLLRLDDFVLDGLREADGDDAPDIDVTSSLASFVTIIGIGCGRFLPLFLAVGNDNDDDAAMSESERACTNGSFSPEALPSGLVVSTSMSSFSMHVLLGSESTSERCWL